MNFDKIDELLGILKIKKHTEHKDMNIKVEDQKESPSNSNYQ